MIGRPPIIPSSARSSGNGSRPIVVSYDSSPVFELIYAESPLEEPRTEAVVEDNTCFRQIEFVGILQGSLNIDLAEKWVDFMLSTPFQEDLPMQMFVFPVNPEAKMDEAFVKKLEDARTSTAIISPEEIRVKREQWLKAWVEVVLR